MKGRGGRFEVILLCKDKGPYVISAETLDELKAKLKDVVLTRRKLKITNVDDETISELEV